MDGVYMCCGPIRTPEIFAVRLRALAERRAKLVAQIKIEYRV